jgi:hypothetical protein
MSHSIFEEYYYKSELVDRYQMDPIDAIEIIIPVYHTNELWEANLHSIYREIPVKRLLISDGGVIDNSLEIVARFPRVEIFNHRHYKSLGKCVAELICEVKSEWFIYLHSDVYLPSNWYDVMKKYRNQYDWYGCPMNITYMYSVLHNDPNRPYAGSQIGRKEAFSGVENYVSDDYVYRFEDFVFEDFVLNKGFKTGKIEDTFHYHQSMYRQTKGLDLKIKSVSLELNKTDAELEREMYSSVLTFVKYLNSDEYLPLYKRVLSSNIGINDLAKIKKLLKSIKEESPENKKHYQTAKYYYIRSFINKSVIIRVKNFIKGLLGLNH